MNAQGKCVMKTDLSLENSPELSWNSEYLYFQGQLNTPNTFCLKKEKKKRNKILLQKVWLTHNSPLKHTNL